MGNVPESSKKSLTVYQEELSALNDLKKRQEIDQLFLNLNTQISKERDLYQSIGMDIIATLKNEEDIKIFIQLINLNENRYQVIENNLQAHFDANTDQKIMAMGQELADKLQNKIDTLKKEEAILQGRMASSETNAEMAKLKAKLSSFDKLKRKILSGLAEVMRSRNAQKEIYQKL